MELGKICFSRFHIIVNDRVLECDYLLIICLRALVFSDPELFLFTVVDFGHINVRRDAGMLRAQTGGTGMTAGRGRGAR